MSFKEPLRSHDNVQTNTLHVLVYNYSDLCTHVGPPLVTLDALTHTVKHTQMLGMATTCIHHYTMLVGVDTKTLYSGWWKSASVMLVSFFCIVVGGYISLDPLIGQPVVFCMQSYNNAWQL